MTDSTPEFSRVFSADRLPSAGIEQVLEAKPDERAALAKRFNLLELNSLRAELVITPSRDQTIKVKGTITADATQSCVVTLEPIPCDVHINIDVMFIPSGQNHEDEGALFTEDQDDDFEIYSGSKIDIGELVAQHLGINLDPYPRKPDAALPATEFGPKIDAKPNPFMKLIKK